MTETSINPTIDLSIFCGEHGRFDFDKPFVRGGFTYATDGRIIVRVPSTEVDTPGLHLPDKLTLVFDPPRPTKWDSIPEADVRHAIEQCDYCMGMNVKPEDWNEAEEGVWDDEDGDCKACRSFGYVIVEATERIAGRFIQARYANRMRTLPGVMVDASRPKYDLEMLRFMFDGGAGAVMPFKSRFAPAVGGAAEERTR